MPGGSPRIVELRPASKAPPPGRGPALRVLETRHASHVVALLVCTDFLSPNPVFLAARTEFSCCEEGFTMPNSSVFPAEHEPTPGQVSAPASTLLYPALGPVSSLPTGRADTSRSPPVNEATAQRRWARRRRVGLPEEPALCVEPESSGDEHIFGIFIMSAEEEREAADRGQRQGLGRSREEAG